MERRSFFKTFGAAVIGATLAPKASAPAVLTVQEFSLQPLPADRGIAWHIDDPCGHIYLRPGSPEYENQKDPYTNERFNYA